MTPAKSSTGRIRLKPADPFDLIRLLARSQSDPRKAVAELVQNSLDAGARRLDITWYNESGRRAIRIRDDGEGVFPELERQEALRRIASTIGHSHKRSLTLEQRRELLTLGKYGIGLLGFWAVGKRLEIRSRVGGGEVWSLRLEEDSAHAEVSKAAVRRLDEEPTYTQVTVREIHDGAVRQIRPAKLQFYLASELRGQLLRRSVEVWIHDRVARGRARKHFKVEPERFRGRRLVGLERLEVPGQEEALLELYLLPAETEPPGRVALACGGNTVVDDIATLDGLSDQGTRRGLSEQGPLRGPSEQGPLRGPSEQGPRRGPPDQGPRRGPPDQGPLRGPPEPRWPWSSGRLEGVIDYPALSVTPGNRRDFQRDAAALHFLAALEQLELALEASIARDDDEREAERHELLAREIRRAFVPVVSALPEYDLFDVRAGGQGRDGTEPKETHQGAAVEAAEPGPGTTEAGERAEPEEGQLFPPGPLAAVRVTPARSRIPPGADRTLHARAVDASGRRAAGDVVWSWRLDGPGRLTAQDAEAVYTAPDRSAEVRVEARAASQGVEVSASATIEVAEELLGREKVSGIPEPEPVHAPLEPWRSRFRGDHWQFNTGHRDYQAATANESSRLRYLTHLLVKEVVLRNFGSPADGAVLERMVEVLTHLGQRRTSSRRRLERS